MFKLIIKSSMCVESDPADPNTSELSALTPALLLDDHAGQTDKRELEPFRPIVRETYKSGDGLARFRNTHNTHCSKKTKGTINNTSSI